MSISGLILAFESSCDETCASVVKCEKTCSVLSNVVSSQIEIHKLYGGVVPEIASRNHTMAILGVCREALQKAGVTLADITHIAAVTEPGLRGAVMVGHVFGESLAAALNKPFIPINHLAGHIASVAISDNVTLPFMSLLVSGGHTSLYYVKAWDDIRLICATIDDACGECFDKVAKLLGLEYPGGVKIEKLANEYCNSTNGFFQFVKHPTKMDAFSYSGLKTAVLTYVNREKAANRAIELPYICASFQHEAVIQLVTKSVEKMKQFGIKTICVCGGVSANGYLRGKMTEAVKEIGGIAIFPKFEYCTDNAAMVAAAAALVAKLHE